MKYLKSKIIHLATNSNNKNITDLCRGIHEPKKGYQPKNISKILNRWKNYFLSFWNVHTNIRQIRVHRPELFELEPIFLEVVVDTEKFGKYLWPGSNQISSELFQTLGEILVSAIHKHIHSIWNMKELPEQWKDSIVVTIHKNGGKVTVIFILGYHCYQRHTQL
jgi:hypothetical protein